MGQGLSGGALTGGPVSQVVAPAGQSAVISSPLGASATDVVTKAGSSATDAAVNANAELLRVAAGIGGTEVQHFAITKGAQASGFVATSTGTSLVLLSNGAVGTQVGWTTNVFTFDGSNITASGSVGNIARVAGATGLCSLRGTDLSGTPGAGTIDKPSGKNAIAIGASSVVVTCAVCTATSRVMITPQTRDATCKELIAVPGAGSFTVSGSANATAALVFSWEVTEIL